MILFSSQGSKEPCYINVLSWIKISTPRRPEDPIPLYGGMKIPCSNAAAIDKKNVHKRQPTIFAVMANPEILRLSGKTAKDPMVIFGFRAMMLCTLVDMYYLSGYISSHLRSQQSS